MASAGSSARLALVLAFAVLKLSVCSRNNCLRVREEWTDDDAVVPDLRLQKAPFELHACVRLFIPPLMANETLQIDFSVLDTGDSDSLLVWKSNRVLQWNSSSVHFSEPHRTKIKTREAPAPSHQAFWLLRYSCLRAPSGSSVSVSVHRNGRSLISAVFSVPHTSLPPYPFAFSRNIKNEPPEASVSVNQRHKHFTVRMRPEQTLNIGLCLQNSDCQIFNYSGRVNTSVHPTLQLSFPFLIPCVCVQLWFSGVDTTRNTQCPLKHQILPNGGDILSSSSARVLGSVLLWEPLCLLDQSQPSVSLCWRITTQHFHCVPAPNGTLHGTKLEYNVSAVDPHPQMCVQFSLNGSRRVFCPFESEGRSGWSVTVVPQSLALRVLVSSDVAAAFAAQLCIRERDVCKPRGPIASRRLDGGAVESELLVSFPFLSPGLCVQVWRVDLRGRRIYCPDFSHRRWGLVFGSAAALLAALIVLFYITCSCSRPSVLRSAERRPVLLVCSSIDPAHVNAVCSLASGLQGELRMDVRLAQWAQCHSQASLAQLGPVPWLYGQCESVQRAGGLVLIAWSPDAQQAFRRWRRSSEERERRDEGAQDSTLTAPVFVAALSCLWTGICSDGHGRGFRLLSFQRLSSGALIPKALRCVRKYCLPKDLCSLIHELVSRRDTKCCRPQLLSKAMAFLASRKLMPRIEAALPKSDKHTLTIPRKSKSSKKTKVRKPKQQSSKAVSAGLSCSKTAPKLLGAIQTPLESD